MNTPDKEQEILTVWNEWAKMGGYRPHKELLPDARIAIKILVKAGYKIEDIGQAIRNYAYIVSPENTQFYFKWQQGKKKWTLAQFLTRGATCKKDDKGARWLWFHPEYFDETVWYSKSAIMQKELQLHREKIKNSRPIPAIEPLTKGIKSIPEPKSRYADKTLDELNDLLINDSGLMKSIILKLRPDIAYNGCVFVNRKKLMPVEVSLESKVK